MIGKNRQPADSSQPSIFYERLGSGYVAVLQLYMLDPIVHWRREQRMYTSGIEAICEIHDELRNAHMVGYEARLIEFTVLK